MVTKKKLKKSVREVEKRLFIRLLKIRLTSRTQNIMVDRIQRNMTVREVAKKNKVSVTWVYALENRVYDQLRKILDEEWQNRIDSYNKSKLGK